jgi:hypothetical protein
VDTRLLRGVVRRYGMSQVASPHWIARGRLRNPSALLSGHALYRDLEFGKCALSENTVHPALEDRVEPSCWRRRRWRRRYSSLDSLDVLDAARRGPEVPVGERGPVTLDEVQRPPELLGAVQRAIDRDRKPGRFLLTGSANLLLMKGVSESLAGRASDQTLWPMTRGEQRGEGGAGG